MRCPLSIPQLSMYVIDYCASRNDSTPLTACSSSSPSAMRVRLVPFPGWCDCNDEARARCGLSCKEIPRNTKQEGCFAYKAIMADENGKINKIVIPDEYKKYTIDTYMLKKEGDEIGNYKKNRSDLFL